MCVDSESVNPFGLNPGFAPFSLLLFVSARAVLVSVGVGMKAILFIKMEIQEYYKIIQNSDNN